MVNLEEYGFKPEKYEELNGQILNTIYPEPLQRLRIIHESPVEDVEKTYFWFTNFLRTELGLGNIIKINDIFSASEQSATFAVSQQRLAAQQTQASQYLATIGQMTNSMFQIIYELRQIEERLDYYDKSYKKDAKIAESAEIALKGMWIDLVEGGAQNPGSVYGLAKEIGFKVLPDLFFRTKLNEVPGLKIGNEKTKEVLKRKLFQYEKWKEHSYEQLKQKRSMQAKYLKQHYSTIKMYMSWVKPYLHNIKKMHMNLKKMDSPDLISAFEGTIIEIEILATEPGDNKINPCILVSFEFTTKPLPLGYKDNQQIHRFVGRTEINMRTYTWTKEEIEKYKEMKSAEDFEMLGTIGGIMSEKGEITPIEGLKESMDSLSEDIKKFIIGKGESFEKNKEEKKQEKPKVKMPSAADPFIEVFKGLRDIFVAFTGIRPKKEKKKETPDKSDSKKKILKLTSVLYKVFKKSNGMVAW